MFKCDCPPYSCSERVSRYLDGDALAGEELASKFRPLVLQIVRKVLGPENQGQREDAYQEAMLRIFSKLDTWEERCPFCKWLAIVATRRVVDLKRKPHPQQLDVPESIVDDRPHGVTVDTQEIVDSVLQKLSVQERLAWELSLNGIAPAQIAQRVGKSERTVQLWLASIRSKLNERLRKP